MTKIDIFSGFLGAGKTTLIKKLIAEAYAGEKLVLIENEFGEINIDGGFLKESGIEISEMSAGCICCSLVGDFNKALREVVEQFHPDRILIEPSGVGKLSDVIVAVERTVDECPELKLNSYVTVADASKVKVYMKNFGEFYNNQIEAAGTIILSRTQKLSQEKLEAAAAMLREKNPDAAILTTPWDELDGKTILSAIEKVSLSDELLEKMRRGDTRTYALYESPKRIMELVDFFIDSGAHCRMCLCNDLTKLHEMSFRGTPGEVKDQLLAKGSYDKGEYAVVVEIDEDYIFNKVEHTVSAEAMLVDAMVSGSLSAKDAVAAVLADENNSYSKNELKAAALNLKRLFGG